MRRDRRLEALASQMDGVEVDEYVGTSPVAITPGSSPPALPPPS